MKIITDYKIQEMRNILSFSKLIINFASVGYNGKVVKVIANGFKTVNKCQIAMATDNRSENLPTETKVVTRTIYANQDLTHLV